MKKCVTLIATFLIATTAFGRQQEKLFSGKLEHGGFGELLVKGVQISDAPGVMVGGRGGWIINHMFVVGGGGYGLATYHPLDADSLLNMGYGGFYLSAAIQPNELVHFTVGSLFRAGGIGFRPRIHNWDTDYAASDTEPFFILEPEVNIELNVSSFLRIAVGMSYRYFDGIREFGLDDQDLNGNATNIQLRFGSF